MTVPAASDEVMLLTRNRLLGLWACVTKRSFADVTFPASSPPSRTRWNDDRVLVTCESDSARPVHAELTVDAVNRPRREVTTKVLARVTVERALPRLPADG